MNSAAIALNRFGLGARPGDPTPADPARWLLGQMDAWQPLPAPWSAVPRTAPLVERFQDVQRQVRQAPAEQRAALQLARAQQARDEYLAAVGARTASALQSGTPWIERLAHFWANHFAVSVDKVAILGLAGALEADAIRPNLLGRFEDLLLAVVRHPAMLLYLDQPQSIGPNSVAGARIAQRNPAQRRGLNENLAREILELHTLGVRSGYTQDDVTEFARALTGWGLTGEAPAAGPPAAPQAGPAGELAAGFAFYPALHEPGPRTVLGHSHAEGGEEQGMAILRRLARAPATAQHIAAKLARHVVADEPPPALVRRLEDAFLRTGGDLPTLYRVLVESPEAWVPQAGKFKSPWEWAVSAQRGLGRRELPPGQVVGLMGQLGQPVWRPGSPAGWDDRAATWAVPDALLRRLEAAQRIGAQAGAAVDARALAAQLLPGGVGASTTTAIARADSGATALALLLVSPEFLRR